jgi:hypothetical protein
MDPTTFVRLGQIRQQEFIQQAEAWRYAEPIWERVWHRIAPLVAARRQKAHYDASAAESLDSCVTAPSTVVDNC